MARNRLLESKTGEKISWLEATMRASKGIGRPAKVGELMNYMEKNVIKEFPETAKTPQQTIYMELYMHSRDSAVGKYHEHIFCKAGNGLWGLQYQDEWRKHRSDKVCDPMIFRALDDRRLFQTEELQECCEKLKEKSEEWELLFGEIILLLSVEVRKTKSKGFFDHSWRMAKYLRPLLNLYVWEITDELLQETVKELTKDRFQDAKYWLNMARKSEYNTKKQENRYLTRGSSRGNYRMSPERQFIESISFPDDYELARYAKWMTVFKYWLWLYRDKYTMHYRLGLVHLMNYTFASLQDRPYRLIRPEDIRTCIQDLSSAQKTRAITLYRSLDNLAYERNLISKRYSLSMHAIISPPAQENDFTQDEINTLRHNVGEIEVDMTLSLLYTGLMSREICELTLRDVDDFYIHVPNERTNYYGRDIPLHPAVIQPLRHVLRYLEERGAQNFINSRRYNWIREMVHTATEKYCGNKHTPKQCRRSFAARAKDAGASDAMISILMGVNRYLNNIQTYQLGYTHPDKEKIYQAVINMQ